MSVQSYFQSLNVWKEIHCFVNGISAFTEPSAICCIHILLDCRYDLDNLDIILVLDILKYSSCIRSVEALSDMYGTYDYL